MSGRWFRFYDSVPDDPKVQRLPAETFRFWINLLCIASRGGGLIPPNADLAFALRLDEKRMVKMLAALREAGLIDVSETGGSIPHNWNERQYKSDSSTERVHRHRNRQCNVSCNVTETATAPLLKRPQSTDTDSATCTPSPTFTTESSAEPRARDEKALEETRKTDASELQKLSKILGLDETDYLKHARNLDVLIRLKAEDSCDFERHIWPAAMACANGHPPRSLAYIRPKSLELRDAEAKIAALPEPIETDMPPPWQWRRRARNWRERHEWLPKWGPPPETKGCRLPPEILAEAEAEAVNGVAA